MAKERDEWPKIIDLPHGHWHVCRGIMFRVIDHGLGADRIECQPANRHAQKRARKREFDNLGRKCEDSDT